MFKNSGSGSSDGNLWQIWLTTSGTQSSLEVATAGGMKVHEIVVEMPKLSNPLGCDAQKCYIWGKDLTLFSTTEGFNLQDYLVNLLLGLGTGGLYNLSPNF